MNIGELERKKTPSAISRVSTYAIVKAVQLFLTVVVGVYLTILVANLGGYVDEIFRGSINESIGAQIQAGWLRDVTDEAERTRIIDETRWGMEEALGLHQPFLLRTFRWLSNGLTLGLGWTWGEYGQDPGPVRSIILQRLPYTLILFGVSNILLFFASVALALFLSRHHGGLLDRTNIVISALTSAPSWIHGLILTVVLAGLLRLLPFPKRVDIQYASLSSEYIGFVLRQMLLPAAAIFFSVFFQSIYVWRTYFLGYSKEDYVEVAQAKGLHPRAIERSYILRPSLPFVITSFALMLIGLWQGAIALEVLFNWPGVGALFFQAIRTFRTELLVGIVVIFAYLLAITVFLMDIFYALVDPRVQVGGERTRIKLYSLKALRNFHLRSLVERMNQPKRDWPSPVARKPMHRLNRSLRMTDPLTRRLRSLTARGKAALREITYYKSALFGLAVILVMIGVSIYTVITIPYHQAVLTWRGQGSEAERGPWYLNPKNVPPVWVNLFRRDKLPETIHLDSRKGTASKNVKPVTEEMSEIDISFPIDYPYVTFPQDLVLYIDSRYAQKKPYITLTWLKPDGEEIELASFSTTSSLAFYPTRDKKLQSRLKGSPVLDTMFADPEAELPRAQPGRYELRVKGFVFEPEADMEAEAVLYGQVFGLSGTDDRRRDISLALLWGMPVALAFGILGAVVTNLIAMTLAAAGAWLDGWLDDIIQRITEVNLILPVLPIAIMIYLMYSKSIWVILGVVVLLNIFGSSLKSYRAAFIQAKESPYVEAARAYGASNLRIIHRYLVPRILPVLIPQLVILVPGFVFYEATLAFLGVSDPYLPTWGKVIYDALDNGLYQGYYYWVLEPIFLLLLTALAFALFGFALDRIFNPRLRET